MNGGKIEKKPGISRIWITAVLITSIPTHTQATLALSDVPLYLTTAVDPNVMFTLDDSGSMQFEILPEDWIFHEVYYVFPRANNVYGGGDYEKHQCQPDCYNDLHRNCYDRKLHKHFDKNYLCRFERL